MCSNFELNAVPGDVMEAFGLDDVPPLPNKDQLRPTDLSLVIGMGNVPLMQPWGLAVDWSKQPMINARSETLAEKATFRGLLDQRCVIPATAYFEWRKTEDGKKFKNRISVAGAPLFGMAGLTDGERFTIVTCAPASAIRHIYHRMPVILPRDAVRAWLGDTNYANVAGHLVPYQGDLSYEEETPPQPAQGDLFG